MPDQTDRLTLTELLDRLPDNNERLISPRNVRDIVGTLTAQYGRLQVLPGDGFTYPGNAGVWDELVSDNWTESPLVASVGFDESAGNGRLTYIGPRPVLANVTMNMSVESEKKALISFRVGINGAVETEGGSEISASAEHNGEVLMLTTSAAGIIQPGDFISCFGRSDKNDDVTVVTAHISIVTSPI